MRVVVLSLFAVGVVTVTLSLQLTGVCADDDSHYYEPNEEVMLWINRIGPYHNPQETYKYFHLPFCKPEGDHHQKHKYAGIGEILQGHELMESGMHMYFAKNQPKTPLCNQVLTQKDAEKFKRAISQHYWYQFFLDDLPIWGMVGEIQATEEEILEMEAHPEREHEVKDSYIYTTKHLSIAYNGDRIIEVNLTSEDPVEAKAGQNIEFSYIVEWKKTNKPFEQRFNRYLDYSFFEHQIHWFSIFNSFMMVIFLCGLVSLILMRTLKNDYAKYRSEEVLDGMDHGFGDDSGWKQVHGDVFRIPNHLTLYTACYGTGMQLIFLVFGVIMLAILGSLYVDPGAMVSAALACYALTSIVAGYSSGSLYNQYFYPKPAPNWIRCMLLTAILLPMACFIVSIGLNIISWYFNTISVVPMKAFVWIFGIWLLFAAPLTVLGTVLGRHWNGATKFPCRVNALPRQIPEHQWYTHPVAIVLLTGWLPFGSIFIEMYFIFTSFWNYKFYYVYGFMLLVFIILAIVSVCVTIVAVYFLLNAEDYRWPWISFLASASTSGYVFLYSVYYFLVKTNMTGFLQTAYYFSYMALFCFALGLMCGKYNVLIMFFKFGRHIFDLNA
mmetsp:Transcript_21028/g.26829  ORF Transcript_21028/g.26829 Transcript_21028/m.26829 type:complete len:609 (-) Transcript_21028:861-2687(-)